MAHQIIKMRKRALSIKKIIEKQDSFEIIDDIDLVVIKLKRHVRELSIREINILEKTFLNRVRETPLKIKIKKSFGRIRGLKSKPSQRKIRAKQQVRLKKQADKRRRELAIEAIPKIRKHHEKMDDIESTERLVGEYEDAFSREKRKSEQGIPEYQNTTIHSTTWISPDPLTPPPTEE